MLKVTTPFDLSLIQELPLTTSDEVENALCKAYSLFSNPEKTIQPHKRISILQRTVTIMEARKEELAILATKEGGKPLTDSRVEVARAINGVQLAANHIGYLKGEEIPMGLTPASENRMAFTTREPIGVVVSISAFNHPLNLIVHQVVTAIAAGCPVIVKPALTTPLSCLALVDILREAGLEEDWCQTVICEDHIAEKLATDSRVGYLSFIGSAKVGWHLRSKLSPGTRCAMEHGGCAPVILDKSAVLSHALPAIAKGGFYHAGQVCVSVQRVFVHDNLFQSVVNELTQQAQNLRVGDPLKEETEVGPIILPKEIDRIDTWIKEAIDAGGELRCGGKRISDTCYSPTIICNPPMDVKVSTEEVFGPVICIYRFSELNEAINHANRIDAHFQAAVFTQDIDVAMHCSKRLNASTVMVNDHTSFRVDWMPFGGRNSSGIGVGGIQHTMNEMTQEKLIIFKQNTP